MLYPERDAKFRGQLVKEWNVLFRVNALIIIDLLSENDKLYPDSNGNIKNTAELISNEVSRLNKINGVYKNIMYFKVESKPQLIKLFKNELSKLCDRHLIPHLHIEFHGCLDKGIEVPNSKDFISWQELNDMLIPLNKKTNNNLGVFLLGCHGVGLRNVFSVNTNKGSPYGFLIYSKGIVFEYELKTRMNDFYRFLFSEKNIQMALDILQSGFDICITKHLFSFECARLFYCDMFGRNRDSFIEYLITKLKEKSDPRIPIKNIRKDAKQRVKKMDKYYTDSGRRFLHGQIPVAYDLIIRLSRELYDEQTDFGIHPSKNK